MSNLNISRSDRLFIEGYQKFFTPDPESLTPEEIKIQNNSSYPKRLKNKYIVHTSKPINVTSYIIPVSDGRTITAYYLVSKATAEKGSSMPLVIFFHGGGWFHSNMDFYLTYLKYFAYTMDVAVLLVDYQLGLPYKFPCAVEDCYDSILWAMDGVKYWKVDPDQVYIMGDGFGANLAAVSTILLRDRKGPTPSGNILLYPITDGRLRTESMETYKETPVLTQKMLSFYIKSYSRETKDSLSPLMSPLLTTDLTRLPPTLIIASGIDPLRDDALLYGKKLKEENNKVNVLLCEESMHGFMPFKYGKGRKEAESAIWQMLHNRNVDAITLLSSQEFQALKRKR